MIPYNTDAPLYHLPIATVGLVVLNTVLFFAVPSSWLAMDNPPPAADLWQDVEPDARVDPDWDPADFQVAEANGGPEVAGNEQDFPAADAAEGRNAAAVGRQSGSLILQYGVGLKPWQWVTSIFMHGGFLHLLFNMIALWAFGLVVEGKVGSLVFLAIYLGIGVGQSAVEQLLMSFSGVGGSLGASAAIFGLLGVAIVWAPRNEFDVFWMFGFRAGTIEIPILVYGFIQFALEFVGIAYGTFGISSGVLHLMGLALGIGLGFVWLRRGWVDCEGWDLISVLRGKEGRVDEDAALDAEANQLVRSSLRSRARSDAEDTTQPATAEPVFHPPATAANPPAAAANKKPIGRTAANRAVRKPVVDAAKPPSTSSASQDVEALIASGNYPLALKLIGKLNRNRPGTFELSQPALFQLVRGLLQAKTYETAMPLMQEHIRRFPENRQTLQLNLAKLLLHAQQPRKARGVLKGMTLTAMDEKSRATWNTLAAHAQQQIADGTIELSD
jgi:membrane associated rhomboid family serine protease